MKKGDRVRIAGDYPRFPNGVYGTIIRKGHKDHWVVKLDIPGIANTEFNENNLLPADGETILNADINASEKKITVTGRGIKIIGTEDMIKELVSSISFDMLDEEPSNAIKDFVSEIEWTLGMIP